MKSTATVLFLCLVAGAALAACPDADGLFTYADGSLMPGRASEAWCDGNAGETGNTQSAYSWDGSALGTEWRIWGMEIDAAGPTLLYSTVNANGDGIAAYSTNYDGGQIWLSKDGAWGDGVNDLAGTITYCHVDIQITYLGGVPVQTNSNIMMTGGIDDCANNCVVEYIVTNAALAWSSAWGTTMPGDYPALLCSASIGELFDVCCPRLSLSCAVPNETRSWGGLKTLYR